MVVGAIEDSTPDTFGMFPRKREDTHLQKFNGHELEAFLEDFTDICSTAKVTSDAKKYKALLRNCIPKVAREIKGFPSYPYKDYKLLLQELQWFYGEDPKHFNIHRVRKFTSNSRRHKITSIKEFKSYHRKYLVLVGQARAHKKISREDYHRYFWEGLNVSLRNRIENRMLATDPDLDVTIPFHITKIVNAAEYVLSPFRFDQHLSGKSGYYSSETESEEERPARHHRKHVHVTYDNPFSSSEEDIEEPVKTRTRERTPRLKSPPPQESKPKKKQGEDMDKLISQMGQLNLADPRLQNLCIVQRDPRHEESFCRPRRGFGGNTFNANNHEFQRDIPPHQLRQNAPPQQFRNSRPGSGPNQNRLHCYGCGQSGHRMSECETLTALVKKGQAVRHPVSGRLQWPNGTQIFKAPDETWVQAISQPGKQASFVRLEQPDTHSVYTYLGTVREEDDASTDEQEELGWIPGEVGDRQTYAAERTDRVSKGTRKKVQLDPPGVPQRMKVFPRRGEANRLNRQPGPIQKNLDRNSNHTRSPKRVTPIDVNKNKFEGKVDGQFLPMQVDQDLVSNLVDNPMKEATSQLEAKPTKVSNPGSEKARDSTLMAQNILDTPLTITIREAVKISPSLRRDLVSATKARHEDQGQTEEKTGLVGVIAASNDDDDDEQLPSSEDTEDQITRLPMAREDLLKLQIEVGDTKMTGIFDTGSQINIMSRNLVEKSGIPWIRQKDIRSRVIGVDGKITQCEGKVPNTRILATKYKLPTFGEFHVIPNPNVVLLGRHWGTMNGAGLQEEKDGTHLSFISKDQRYQCNICPTKDESGNFSQNEGNVYLVGEDKKLRAVYAARTHKLDISKLEEPDSEEEDRYSSEDEPIIKATKSQLLKCNYVNSPRSVGEDPPTPTSPQTQDAITSKKDYIKATTDKEPGEISDEEDRRAQGVKKRKRKAKFEIDSDLHESYIKMVQKGISNDEWNTFCRAETHSRKRDDDLWKEWTTSNNEHDDRARNSPRQARSAAPSPELIPEPSQTLREPDPYPQNNQSDEDDSDHNSNIVASLRNRKTRRKTERAMGEEYKRFLKSYERKERLSRKNVRSNGAPITNSDMFALSARITPETDNENNYNWDNYLDNPVPSGNEEIPYYIEDDEEDSEPGTNEGTDEEEGSGDEGSIATDWSSSDGGWYTRMARRLGLINGEKTMEEYLTERGKANPKLGTNNLATHPNFPSNDQEPTADGPEKSQIDQPDNESSGLTIAGQTKFLPITRVDREDPLPGNETVARGKKAGVEISHLERTEMGEQRKDPPKDETQEPSPPELSPTSTLMDSGSSLNEKVPDPGGTPDTKEVKGAESGKSVPATIGVRESMETEEVNEQVKTKASTEYGNEESNETPKLPPTKEPPGPTDQRLNSSVGNPEGNCRIRERFTLRNGELEDLDDEDFYGKLVPCGTRKLPEPSHLPNGLLAAINLVPFADDICSGDQYFEGLGVTIVTNDARGTPIHYHGDATIRLSQPPPGVLMEVPKEDKVNEMRERLFRMKNFAQKDTYRSPITNNPNAMGPCGCGITKDELEEMVARIIKEPLKEEDKETTYEVHKTKTGVVIAQRRPWAEHRRIRSRSYEDPLATIRLSRPIPNIEPPGNHTQTAQDNDFTSVSPTEEPWRVNLAYLATDPGTNLQDDEDVEGWSSGSTTPDIEQRSKQGNRDAEEKRAISNKQDSQKGSDPPTSDQAPVIEAPTRTKKLHLERQDGSRPLATGGDARGGPGEGVSKTEIDRNKQKDIKDENSTHQVLTKPRKLNTRNSPNTSQTPGQSKHVHTGEHRVTSLASQLNELPLQNEPLSLVRMSGQSKSFAPDNAPPGVGNPPGIPPPSNQTPAVIYLSHIAPTPKQDCPQGTSYIGYDATVVQGGVGGPISAQQGKRLYFLLWNSSSDEEGRLLKPPEEPEPEQYYALVETPDGPRLVEIPDDTLCRCSGTPHLPGMNRLSTLDPRAPAFIPQGTTVRDENNQPLSMEQAVSKLRDLLDDTENLTEEDVTLTQEEVDELREAIRRRKPSKNPNNDIPYHEADSPPPLIPAGLPKEDTSADDTLTPEQFHELQELVRALKGGDNGPIPTIVIPDDALLGSQTTGNTEHIDLPIPGSPPDLHYPMALELAEDEKAAKVPTINVLTDPDRLPDVPVRKEASAPDREGVPDAIKVLRNAATALGTELEDLKIEEEVEMMEALAEMGILQIAYDMGKEKEAGRTLDKDYWVPKIVRELKERVEGKACFSVRKVSDPSDEMDTEGFLPPLETVPSTGKTSPVLKPVPLPMEPPYSPANWYPDVDVPPYIPTSPAPGNSDPQYVPRSPDPDPLDEIRLRMSMLEDRVEVSYLDLKEKLREIESQMAADECLMNDWRDTGLKNAGGRVRSERKRTYRRKTQDLPTHRYPTRYSNSFGGDRVAEIKRDVGRMGDKMRRMEGRIDDVRREMKGIDEKISAGWALETRIDDLRDRITSHQEAQADINRVLHTELADLKNSLGPAIASHSKTQQSEIATLQQQVQYLYGYAASLFVQPNKTYVKNLSSLSYPTPANSPNPQLVTAF